jgi:hypothetical protein
MSDAGRQKPKPPELPKLRGKKAEPKRGTGKRKAEKPSNFRIEVDPEDEAGGKPTITERLKEDAKTGVPGLMVSLGLHLLILMVLFFVVVQGVGSGSEDTLDFGWLSSSDTAVTQKSEGPLDPGGLEFKVKKKEDEADPKKSDSTKKGGTGTAQGPAVTPVDVKELFNSRGKEQRQAIMNKQGAGKETEKSIERALDWLQRQQRGSGNWRLHEGYPNAGDSTLRTDTSATAMALLAFLGAGHTRESGDYKETVRKGLMWLKGIQKDDGDFHDHVELGRQTAFYAHSQATIAFCEAAAMTGDVTGLQSTAERGVKFLLDTQHPSKGGWKYQPQNELTVGDLSVTGWCLMALHSARAAGIDVSDEAFRRSSSFLDSVQTMDGARYRYEPHDPPDRVRLSMTAEGLLCRQYLGWPKDFPSMQSGTRHLLQDEHRPEWVAGKRNIYEWYYIAQTLHNMGGDSWKKWYRDVNQTIIAQQQRGPRKPGVDVDGSWNPVEPAGSRHEYAEIAGRLYFTTMCLLVLETPFRHVPIYRDTRRVPAEAND